MLLCEKEKRHVDMKEILIKNIFTGQMFMAGAFLNVVSGIVLQLVFIPVLMVVLIR